MPQRVKSHRNENASQREFESLIDPFFVPSWNQKDYGIDATVELASFNDDKGTAVPEGKNFHIQLKSIEKIALKSGQISYSVDVEKINYWYGCNLPVMFVLYDVSSNTFYFLWIDDSLISYLDQVNAKWATQTTITIKIPTANVITKSTLEDIRTYVRKWRNSIPQKLTAGKYFSLRDQSLKLLVEYDDCVKHFGFTSVEETIKQIKNEINLSLYRLTITGLSRAGKSSLINALLNKNISPVGFFPTTGVPIQIIPGASDVVTIYFENSAKLSEPFNEDIIRAYASQDENPDNKKKVQLISISIRNQNLERGVSIFDVPGLDDPNDKIFDYTVATVRKANAIVYVIDVSPAENGGFLFSRTHKRNLNEFRSLDKVFLVFNKADAVSKEKLELVKTKVKDDLKTLMLEECVGERVFYISTKKQHVDYDSIEQLNVSLWNFILNENRHGLFKLGSLAELLLESVKNCAGILNVMLLDNEKRQVLEKQIGEVQGKIPQLSSSVTYKIKTGKKLLFQSIELKRGEMLKKIEHELRSIPINSSLPKSPILKKRLVEEKTLILEAANAEYAQQIHELKNHIDEWVEDNLKQIRELLTHNNAQKTIDFVEIYSLEMPSADYSSTVRMAFGGLIFGALFAPAYVITTTFIGLIGDLFISEERRRSNQIKKTMEVTDDKTKTSMEKMRLAYGELYTEHLQVLERYVRAKLDFYFDDLNSQLRDIRLKKSLTVEEVDAQKRSLANLDNLEHSINELRISIQALLHID